MCEADDFADVGYCVDVESARMKERPGAFVCRCAAALFVVSLVVLLQHLQTLHLFANLPSCRSAEMAEEIAMDGAARKSGAPSPTVVRKEHHDRV